MPPGDVVTNTVGASAASASPFAGLVGPLVPGMFGVDELSLAILVGLAILLALLILCLPATDSFFGNLFLLGFFFGGAFAVVTATHVITFYVAWELTTLFAWGIAQISRDPGPDDEGVVPFHAAGALGSFAMIAGLTLLASSRHTLSLSGPPVDPAPASLGLVPPLILLALILKTYGLLSETWERRPGGGRLTLDGATLAGSGVLAIGMYPFFRFFGPLLSGATDWREQVFWAMAALSILASLAALGETDFQRALCYGVFGQFCLLAAVFSAGAPAAVLGAVVGAIANAFAFTGLFLSASAARAATAQTRLRRVGGLAQRMPVTASLFVICSLSLIGIPPLGSTLADRLVGTAAQSSPTLPLVWAAAIGLTLMYLARLFAGLFLGELRGPVQAERRLPVLLAGGGVVGTLVLFGTIETDLLALLGPVARLVLG
jgi:formate hydrogenlyase subunit 3/multisubunit Na+/H+ antiporter MnhD subunit